MGKCVCADCGVIREEITGSLCYRCRCTWQEREMRELREENKRLLEELDEAESRACALEQKEAAREKRLKMERCN